MKINIIGWYDRNNCGDESFKSVFNDIFSGNEIYFTSNQSIENCDHYIIGGGDVVKSWYLDNISDDKLLNFIGVGLGYKSEAELLKNRNCGFLYVRNKEDVDIFNEIDREASYTPDIVFYLQKPTEIVKNIDSVNNKKKMAIILTDHVNPNVTNINIKEFNYNEFFKWELSETLDYLSQYYQIYFVALSEYHYAHDNKMSIDVQSRMNNGYKATLITESKDPYKLMDILQQMDLIVSMKFHGLIFSTICNVPFINIGLSRKTNKFCAEMNLKDLSFEPRTFNKEDFLTKVKYVENNIVDIKEKLNQIDKKNKEILKNNIDKWKEMIK